METRAVSANGVQSTDRLQDWITKYPMSWLRAIMILDTKALKTATHFMMPTLRLIAIT
jgi:hypothetical protein